MKTPDLHPDELLDKDARGELWGSELALLEAHLSQCDVCRFERRARLDFKSELEAGGPDVEDLVAKVLAGQHVGPHQESDVIQETVNGSANHARRRRRIAPLLVAAVAAAMSIAGVAVAGGWTGGWPRLLGGGAPSESATPSSSVAAPITRPAGRSATTPLEAASAAEDVTPVPALPLPTPPSEAPRTAVHALSAAPVISATSATAPAVATPQVVAPQPSTDEVGELFARANRERARGQHGDAVRSYRELLVRFPNAPETRLSRATLGRLLLDDGDAMGALDQLDHYLQDGDPTLREEAIVDRALALGRLGRTDDERKAWTALLDGYPQSIHCARARVRIGEIGSR